MKRRDVVRNLPDGFKTLSRRYNPDLKRESVACVYREVTASPREINVLRQLAAGQSVRVF